jgi:sigma-B regulation protein RsbU (phosphoserine phosphatase)
MAHWTAGEEQQQWIAPMDGQPIVLLVDDDPTALAMLTGMLRQEGFETLGASTAREAKDLIAQAPFFDLAILDVNLPDGNGLDLCRLINGGELTTGATVFILSIDGDVETKVAGFEAGASDYITKPFHRAEVLARVRTHLRLKQASRSVIELQSLKLAQLALAQNAMTPRPEQMPEAKFDLRCTPLQEAGGDLCQVLQFGPYLHDYIVADVCGHDVGTVITTGALQALFKQNCSPLYSPNEALHTINRVTLSLLPEEQFITVVYARLNRKTNRLTVVSAGHPPAVVQKVDGTASALWLKGDVVGAFETPEFQVLESTVRPGDRVFLFSDALIENGEKTKWEDGIEQFLRVCGQSRGMELQAEVSELAGLAVTRGAPTDDITLMGIEV